ncbi:MAG: response regulator [Polyangiaceae bacterium]
MAPAKYQRLVVARAKPLAPAITGAASETTLVGNDALVLDGLRVLVVDDDVDLLTLCASVLKRSGAKPTVARDVKTALRKLAKSTPDVVVSDIGFDNGEDGHAFIRALRQSRHAYVPVVAISGNADDREIKNALAEGFDAYLVKPVPLESLVSAIKVAHLARDP